MLQIKNPCDHGFFDLVISMGVWSYFSVLAAGLAGSLAGAFVSVAAPLLSLPSEEELLLSLFSEDELFSVWLLAGRLVDDEERWSVT